LQERAAQLGVVGGWRWLIGLGGWLTRWIWPGRRRRATVNAVVVSGAESRCRAISLRGKSRTARDIASLSASRRRGSRLTGLDFVGGNRQLFGATGRIRSVSASRGLAASLICLAGRLQVALDLAMA
jgi:hypothetical protein